MIALVYTDKATALALIAAIDKAAGCPIQGRDIGGGRHVPPDMSTTVTMVNIIEHPSKDGRVAVPIDDPTVASLCAAESLAADTRVKDGQAKLGDTTIATKSAETLDGTWTSTTTLKKR